MKRGEKEEERRFVGIDLGKKTHQDAFVEDGEVRFSNGKLDLVGRQALYQKLKSSDIVAVEAGGIAFQLAKEMEQTVGCKVVVLNPGNLAVIYRSMKKTDKEDSLKLARLIEYTPEDRLPVVAVPTDKELEMREMASEKKQSAGERTSLINKLHALFPKAGIVDMVKKNLATAKAREEAVKRLNGHLRTRAEHLMEMLKLVEGEIERISKIMAGEKKNNEEMRRLMTVPGIGEQTAYTYLAHVNYRRFSNAGQVSNFIGLVPRVDISCSIVKYGRITKRGNGTVRSLLNQASWALVRSKKGGALKDWYLYQTAVCGKSKKKTIVAVSRKLAEMMYTLLRDGSDYEERDFKIPELNKGKPSGTAAKLAVKAIAAESLEQEAA
jgi:transposase